MPSSPEQYIHRLGRTARAGKSGKGILFLTEFEECFLEYIKDLQIRKGRVPNAWDVDFKIEKQQYFTAMNPILEDKGARRKRATKVYVSLLHYYSVLRPLLEEHWEFKHVVNILNKYITRMFRLDSAPEVFGHKIEKMKLRPEDGVRESKHWYNNMGREKEEEEEDSGDEEFDPSKLKFWLKAGAEQEEE